MPSDLNYIDDFFRQKEEESVPGNALQDRHWQQMQQLLQHPQQAPRIRTWKKRLYWQAAAVIIVVAAGAFLFTQRGREPEKAGVITSADAPRPLEVKETERPMATGIAPVVKETAIVSKPYQSSSADITARDNRNLEVVADTGFKDTELLPAPDSREVLASFFKELEKPAQEFYIDPAKDTTLVCAEGTSIFIPAGSFETLVGSMVQATVLFRVKEFYSLADMVGNKLTTLSNGQPLATGGMLHIAAVSSGKPVRLREGKGLDLKMPTSDFDSRMQLFTAADADSSLKEGYDPQLNWIPRGQRQLFYNTLYKVVTVTDLPNEPYTVAKRRKGGKTKSIAKFMISSDCKLSIDSIQAKLQKLYGSQYDEIRVKRSWYSTGSNWFGGASLRKVGDPVQMPLSRASKLGFISREDSLRKEKEWQKRLEAMVRDGVIDSTLYNSDTLLCRPIARSQPFLMQQAGKEQRQSYQELVQVNKTYNFTVKSLGWINCDRFTDYPPGLLADLKVSPKELDKKDYVYSMLVFRDENVLMAGNRLEELIRFDRIPKGTNLTVICIKASNGKVYTCMKDAQFNETLLDVDLVETNPKEFSRRLKQLGNVTSRG